MMTACMHPVISRPGRTKEERAETARLEAAGKMLGNQRKMLGHQLPMPELVIVMRTEVVAGLRLLSLRLRGGCKEAAGVEEAEEGREMGQTICPCVAAPVARKISRKARRAWQMGRCGLEGGAAVVERRPWSPLRIAVREGSLRSRARGGRGGTGRRRGIGSGEGTRTEREGGTKCVETMRAWLWRRCGRSCTPKPCTPKPCTPKPCTLCLLGAVAAVLCLLAG